jgi:hypothetical protein
MTVTTIPMWEAELEAPKALAQLAKVGGAATELRRGRRLFGAAAEAAAGGAGFVTAPGFVA